MFQGGNMGRPARLHPIGVPQHIVQRGNNRQSCFLTKNDVAVYANSLLESSRQNQVDIHAWVFMTNHIHLLASPQKEGALSRMMQSVGCAYAHYFNKKHERTGTLWEGRYLSCIVQTEVYLLRCYRYIELNPVRAGIVSDPADYGWSSYRCNALGVPAKLCTPHELYLRLGSTAQERQASYRDLFSQELDASDLEDIRTSTNRGLALGDNHFKSKIEALFARPMRPLKPGPKPK
ncbi:MAG: transposase [Pseudomonadales bacterium]